MSVKELQERVSPKFTEQVVLDILKKKSGLHNVAITKIDIGSEGSKGDSYLSNLLRFTLSGTGKKQSGESIDIVVPVIVKYLLKNLARRKTFRCTDFFKNEYFFYEKVWNGILKFQQSKNVQNRIIPLVVAAHCDGVNDFIAMEDLTYEGYRGSQRSDKLDYNRTLDILKLFAEFHGVAMAYKHENLKEFEQVANTLEETYFHERHRHWYINFMNKLIEITKDAIGKELDPVYLERFEKFLASGDLYQKLCDYCRVRSPLSTITHGDAWLPNFMINPDENKYLLIDFQLARYTTLSNDLIFFLFACVDPELTEKHYDDFVEEYYKYFCEVLRKYGTNPDKLFSLEDLKQDVAKSVTFGVGMCMEGIIMSLLDDDQVSDLDAMTGDQPVPIETVWIVDSLKEQYKRQRLASMIKFIVDKNFI